MKYTIPEISWHNRDPVLSVDFQPRLSPKDPLRLASGGTDSHVLIWHITISDNGTVNLEVAADLTRHQKAVNVVRWSPNGQMLASGDDDSIIFIWKLNSEKEPVSNNMEQGDEVYKESWTIFKTLRGHMEDVLDISWSPDSASLASGSVDNKLIIWDVNRGKSTSILSDHKGFVQGVAWDPQGQLIATASSDRVFRTFDVASRRVCARSRRAAAPLPAAHELARRVLPLYHDDTLQTYYRRLHFSPCGMLIAVPAGRIEPESGKMDVKPINAVYIYTRHSLKVPAVVIPTESPPLAVRWSPRQLPPRARGPPPALPLPSPGRALLAVATRGAVLLYDTQQRVPVGLLHNIHYTRLTDLAWSRCGRLLLAASTDGFCSLLSLTEPELGAVEQMEVEQNDPELENPKAETQKLDQKTKEEPKPVNRIDSFIKFKAPEKSPKKTIKTDQKNIKTPIKLDLDEVAMPSWSDNSSSEIIKPKDCMATIEIEDSEDIKLVYEETEANKSSDSQDKTPEDKKSFRTVAELSPKRNMEAKNSPPESAFFKKAKVTDAAQATAQPLQSPRAPRRVNFVTLSSPKNSKKKC